jgi:hypothetical protein
MIYLLAMKETTKYKIELSKLEEKNNIGHFVCMNADTIALELMHAYDTAAFLLRDKHICAVKKATCYLANSTNNSRQTVCQKQLEKKAEQAKISKSPENAHHHGDPSLGEAGVKFEESGEVDDDDKA